MHILKFMHIQLESNIFIKIFQCFKYLNYANQVLSGITSGEKNIYIYIYICIIHSHIYVHVVTISEKAMAPHSSTLAWKIPWMEEPGGLQSMGSLRVGYD